MGTPEEDNLTSRNNSAGEGDAPVQYLAATSVMGALVYNKDGKKLGDIKDIMVSLQDGNIKYLVIEFETL